MRRDQFRSPYPQLGLTLEEKRELHDTAIGLLDEAQEEFEHYLWKHGSTIDLSRWNLLQGRENAHVYVEKRQGSDMQLLLVVGTVEGTLHDVMYGELNHSTDDIRLRNYYANNTLRDGAVLETILEPTHEEPFQSMTLRWLAKDIPFLLRAVAKPTDGTFVCSTGMRELSNGERCGCSITHTVASPKWPPLPQYNRLDVSVRRLYRQHTSNTVQLFSLMYVDIKASIVTTMVLKSIADALLSVIDMAWTGNLKKLSRLIQRRSALTNEKDSRSDVLQGTCSVCNKKSRSASRGLKSCCAICRNNVCKRCRLYHDIGLILPDRQLKSVKMQFCMPCFSSTKQLDAFTFAQDDVHNESRTASGSCVSLAIRGNSTASSSCGDSSAASSVE